MPSRPPRFRRPALAAALLAASALTGVAGWHVMPAYAQQAAPPIDVTHPAAQALPGFADLTARVEPAVVTITTTSRQAVEEDSSFTGGRGGPMQTVHALGSGFIIDADGHIVTNNHVVKDATDIHVTLSDGREMAAKLVGADPRTDLAVLQVKSDSPLPHLALGNSDTPRVGDWVVAVGNPFGLGGTVTAGILSARGRSIGQGPYDDILQIDAPINRGNSGGPLFAQDGSVIGVNTAIFSPSGGSVGIGFAIPSNIVKSVVSQLISTGTVQRGWLGVATQAVTPTMAAALNLPKPEGALVSDVQKASPAAAAGLQAGDVITAVAGQPVHAPRDLARIVAGLRPGDDSVLAVRRDGADRTVTVTVRELQEPRQAAQAGQETHGAALGLALVALDGGAREALDVPEGTHGVVIAEVRDGSPAQEAGLKRGDVVEAVGPRAVATPEEASAALREATGKSGAIALRVLRGGQTTFVAVAVPGRHGKG